MNIFRFLQHNRTHELIRCAVPPTMPLPQKIILIKGLVKLQSSLISGNKINVEVFYNDSFWKFSLETADDIYFKDYCLWVKDYQKAAEIPFSVHYIQDIFCTTEIKHKK